MKLLTENKIRELDLTTIDSEPISSIDLMERASDKIAQWIIEHINTACPLVFLIGKGNNGGDGLAVARMLSYAGYRCRVYLAFGKEQLSEESRINAERLPAEIAIISEKEIDSIPENAIVIDALLGTGVKGEITEPIVSIIRKINQLPNKVIAIDLPSGMKSEFGNAKQDIIKAHHTLTLEFPKLAMLLPEAGEYCGEISILPIGLDKTYIENTDTTYYFATEEEIRTLLIKRGKFAHKGTYGHTLLICGSRGMAGAAILAAGGALRSGCGLVTAHIPCDERFSIQAKYPSAMLSLDENSYFSQQPQNIEKYSSIGIGCGLGQADDTKTALENLLKKATVPLVIDADALNIIAENKHLIKLIPANSVLTPHPGELKRLVGEWNDEEEKINLCTRLAKETNSVIVVKGAYTMIALPEGKCIFNPTGNPGMAKGGSGDVLTGFIAGLIARGYEAEKAAILGVYFHGVAGNKAAKVFGQESMNSLDMIDFLNVEF
ncbi:NAD(P)H-hydrate dehydratase [Paludibacter sp. 221]|uniref:NAD(P)H-hydrate dehydratase n=1 Tax=Paludibacter sp. 221 TaxID=2302939 RepID=UPI0013D7947B|nr:NAD(P)H-hydrate dehydratase [Paludibacter sp. 221]NDV47857.1 NAD(P)H-hydrate dehydratase [Paludibacter sp. 221]